jgi:DNA helicase-2/ATP-dependent DNA helicase PcrA
MDDFGLEITDSFDVDKKNGQENFNRVNIFEGLNKTQLVATETIDGPLLILAGAGTGKTKVLTSRIANMILNGYCYADNILAVTFTNKAAQEMKMRIEKMIGSDRTKALWVGTFHSICVRILRIYHKLANIPENFIILDDGDQQKIFKQILEICDIDDKRYPVKMIRSLISKIKNQGVKYDDTNISRFSVHDFDIVEVYTKYQQKLELLGAVDFDDLILYTIILLKSHPDVLEKITDRLRYVLVDEYQDTGTSQHILLKLLASKHQNICAVGDEDQSIYTWRGANIKNIMNFGKDYPNAKIIKLETNYRSTKNILSVAMKLIGNNNTRYSKELQSTIDSVDKVKIYKLDSDRSEGVKICQLISKYNQSGVDLKDMAILVRATYQMRSIEESLISAGISYVVVDGIKFYDRREVKDLISYLRVIYSSTDFIAFERAINSPKRGVGAKTLENIFNESVNHNLDIIKTLESMIGSGNFSTKLVQVAQSFVNQINMWQDFIEKREEISLAKLAEKVYFESGYHDALVAECADEGNENRLENIRDFISSLAQFNNLGEFLEHIALISATDYNNNHNAVNILTIHGAKGLEYDTVFLPGWEEDIFPSKRSIEESSHDGLEEERRLGYVAITRAKRRLSIFSCNQRMLFGRIQSTMPSRFIDEISESTGVEFIDEYKQYKNFSNNQYGGQYKKQYGYNKKNSNDEDGLGVSSYGGSYNNNVKVANVEVSHSTFGRGKVIKISGNFAEVIFEKDGVKRSIRRDFLTEVE